MLSAKYEVTLALEAQQANLLIAGPASLLVSLFGCHYDDWLFQDLFELIVRVDTYITVYYLKLIEVVANHVMLLRIFTVKAGDLGAHRYNIQFNAE